MLSLHIPLAVAECAEEGALSDIAARVTGHLGAYQLSDNFLEL